VVDAGVMLVAVESGPIKGALDQIYDRSYLQEGRSATGNVVRPVTYVFLLDLL